MIKLVIFDLDGVLITSKELHFETLNAALVQNDYTPISREEHLSTFDGLSTTKKLNMLTELGRLPASAHNDIWRDKQIATTHAFERLEQDYELIGIMANLKKEGIKIACASNSIRNTVKLALLNLGLMPFVDYWISNEDVKRSKPYPEMYWECMKALGAVPKDTVIIEDSHIGRQGALDSGANLLPVESRSCLTASFVDKILQAFPDNNKHKIPWRNPKMNVLIPMAGEGSRFANAGYTFPKPLIEVNGQPMIQLVKNNLNIESRFIFLVRKEHYEKYNLKYMLNLIAPNCEIVIVDCLTKGAACTTLLAKDLINNNDPLLIANSDQFLEWNSSETLYAFGADEIDGGIVTFEAVSPKWSFVKLGEDGFVSEVAEKKPISNIANTGIYFWRRGRDYVKYAEQMIEKNITVNGEFFVAPVFNEAIADGKKFRIKNCEKMWGLGTPEDLEYFLSNYKSQKE